MPLYATRVAKHGNAFMNTRNEDQEAEEPYANAFYHFTRDLSILSEGAETQCEMRSFDNVAWETKEFFMRSAEAVLNLHAGRLSSEHESIEELLRAISAIPNDVVNLATSNSKGEHLLAMSQPCWFPIRVQARALSILLAPEVTRINSILWP